MSMQAPELDADMVVTIHVGPGGLDRYLAMVEDRPGPRIKYFEGSLTLVSPSRKHERASDRLDGVVKAIGSELDIAYHATASTLYRREGLDAGIEADKTYYIAHAAGVEGLDEDEPIDLAAYPPPDLAIEVVVTHPPAQALLICRELGIPEVWVYRARKATLEFLVLDADRHYLPAPASRSFPFLTPTDVLPWAGPHRGESDDRWDRRLRAWVRAVLAPRLAGE